MMPEGPECKRTADQLDAYCAGWSLSKVEILSGRYVTHGPPKGFAEFCSTWLPAEIEQVSCKGKFIYYLLRSKEHGQASIWSTLGMSGRWALRESDHSRVRFTLSSSGMEAAASESDKVLYYTDPRNFGTLTFSMDDSELESKLSTLGPSYLAGEVTALEFVKLARKANRRYAAVFLMDQSKTSGIGNYILSEALFRSWIDPFLRVGQIPDSKLIDLYQAIMEVITDSYASFGVSRGAKKQAPPIGMFRGLDNNAGSYSEHLQAPRLALRLALAISALLFSCSLPSRSLALSLSRSPTPQMLRMPFRACRCTAETRVRKGGE
jgi:formamidopyrimidine-DNA glycosylase